MNTIFKFYFQAWLIWSLAAGYATVALWRLARGSLTWVARAVCLVTLLMSLAYPIYGLWYTTGKFNTEGLTLDGNAYRKNYEPDEVAAFTWLRNAAPGVVAEAVGGQYSAYARVSMLTGQPAVLGWPGHESQWRGGSEEMGSRETDIETLYRTADWDQALGILKQYNIRYIYIGNLERSAYRVNENKFQSHLKPAFQNNSVIIYEVPDIKLLQPAQGG